MAIAGLANDSAAIAGWYLAFSFAFRTDLACLYVDDGSSMIAVILHVILDQSLALLTSTGLAYRTRNLPRFMVLKFNDKLPFGCDGDLSHAHTLYAIWFENTIYCMGKSCADGFSGFHPCMSLQANRLLRIS